MDTELTGWDKIGDIIRHRTAMSAHTGRKPLTKEILANLRKHVVGEKNVDLPVDWIGRRPSLEELAGNTI